MIVLCNLSCFKYLFKLSTMRTTNRTLLMKFSCTFFTHGQMITFCVNHIGFKIETNLTQLLISQLLSRIRILSLVTLVELRQPVDIVLILVQHIIRINCIWIWTPVIQTDKNLASVPFLFINQQMAALAYFIPKLIGTIFAFNHCQLMWSLALYWQ